MRGFLVTITLALVLLASCGSSDVTITGQYCCTCTTHVTFLDEAGDQVGIAPIEEQEVKTDAAHPGSCGMSGTYSVTLPRRDAYEVQVEDFSIPVERVMTYDQLEQRDFKWDIIAFGGGS